MSKQEESAMDHMTFCTSSLQALMRVVRQKTERKDGEIERLEKEARRDVIEGLQVMEALIKQMSEFTKESVEQQEQQFALIRSENALLQKKVEVCGKEIELLKTEQQHFELEKNTLFESYEERMAQLHMEITNKNKEIDRIENEILGVVNQKTISEDFRGNTKEEGDAGKQIEIADLRNRIETLKKEVDNLKGQAEVNAQTNDVMWVTIMKGRNENSILKTLILEHQKGRVMKEIKMFDDAVLMCDYRKICLWTKMTNFEQIGKSENDGDEKTWSVVKGRKNVLCLKITQIGSVFGYFHSGEHPHVDKWSIPQTTDFVFSLKNLFNKPPVIFKKNINGKLEELKSNDVCLPIIVEEMDSPCLAALIFQASP
ncbi:hypothetical protein EIN_098610 [Entamoeba invadens IP1]|uniref:Uncharacterized protein n=1 Tax=Entamoeba invadens IP1 TaxID=370355 RepID=A0A0A1U0V4_ENTIV|nr:hypothetical protein EIN_098610 [Entamoeba invadens IP1]ELP87534.1 hypothetical protein EIN_098610 [Entamoeba invadens IP1]|eukprot:XP_004254305.1 hypothetical protein EIN_098610 [Entamoeba invadens IP1]